MTKWPVSQIRRWQMVTPRDVAICSMLEISWHFLCPWGQHWERGKNVASFRADDIMCLVTGDQKKTCLWNTVHEIGAKCRLFSWVYPREVLLCSQASGIWIRVHSGDVVKATRPYVQPQNYQLCVIKPFNTWLFGTQMVLFFSRVWLETAGILFCIVLESDMCLVCVYWWYCWGLGRV